MDNKKQPENNMEPSVDQQEKNMESNEEQQEKNMESNEEQQENDMELDEGGDATSKYVPYFDIAHMTSFFQYHVDVSAKRIEAVNEAKEQLLQERNNIEALQRAINKLIESSKQNAKS
ncbi:hypothetical protein HA402_007270 [Bradysia odoriphaga]|nr:hypothetical protein HA402_007270 [Bradysia odoriphaga]